MKQRKVTQEEFDTVYKALLASQELLKRERIKSKEKFNTHLIRVLEIKPNKKYVLFFPRSSGIRGADLASFDAPWADKISFLLEDTEGIIAMEV